MKARMQELLRLLTLVVERVRAANERSERAEARAVRMSVLLDAMAEENTGLRTDLEQAESAAEEARRTIRSLRDRVEAGERLADALEARAADAELRIRRAADALGPSPLSDSLADSLAAPLMGDDERLTPHAALH